MIHEQQESFGRYLGDLVPGDIYRHYPAKTITESENQLFSLLTMNHHPVHIDAEYSRAQHHGRILVVGTYVFSLVVGMTVSDISGKAIANLEYEHVRHDGPVFIGDTLRAETEVLSITESQTKPDRGVAYVETRAFNQKSEQVMTLRRRVLVRKRDAES